MSPNDKFYEVTVCISTEDEKGRTKKKAVKFLIDAPDTNGAEKNTFKMMEGTLDDWEIVGINLSRIQEVMVRDQI